MKKFLLVLSCFLATWCSVQAGPKSSPEVSLMQASAPAAAPVTAIKGVSYNSKTQEITVTFTVSSGSKVTFDLKTNDGIEAEGLGSTDINKGYSDPYKSTFKIKPEMANSEYTTVVFKVDGVVRSGSGVAINPNPNPGPINDGTGSVGDIYDVRKSSDLRGDNLPKSISFDYNLRNTNSPYLCIKKGDNPSKGDIVAKIKINNTNGKKNVSYSSYSNDFLKALESNTMYSACLYDGTEDLGINYVFDMPLKKKFDYNFICTWVPSMNQYHIMLSKNVDPNVTVSIWVEPINGGTYQYTVSKGDPMKDYYFGVSNKGYYVVRVRWSNGEVRSTPILR